MAGEHEYNWDWIVVGSGFGGSVAALRLAEKGCTVCVNETGRRLADDEFERTTWDLRSFLYMPKLGCKGIMRAKRLADKVGGVAQSSIFEALANIPATATSSVVASSAAIITRASSTPTDASSRRRTGSSPTARRSPPIPASTPA